MFDVTRLTVGEMAEVERISGVSVTAMGDTDAPKGKLFAALAYVAKRRENPGFTLDDANNLTVAEVGEILGTGGDDAENPTM